MHLREALFKVYQITLRTETCEKCEKQETEGKLAGFQGVATNFELI